MTPAERTTSSRALDLVYAKIDAELAKPLASRDLARLAELRARAAELMATLYSEEDGGVCAFCGETSEGEYSVHRDGFSEGPEVALCNACGSKEEPSLEEIWARISQKRVARRRRMARLH